MAHSDDLSKLLVMRKELRELTERVDDLDELRKTIRDVAVAVAELAAQQEAASPPPIHWPDLDDDAYREARTGLQDWMRDVLVVRYPLDAAALRPCWWEHLDVVDALTAGWHTWSAAFRNPAAEPTARADWLGRWLPQMTAQVKTSLQSCTPTLHEEPLRNPGVVAGVLQVG